MTDRTSDSSNAPTRAPAAAWWKIIVAVTAAMLVVGLSPVAWRAGAMAYLRSMARHKFAALSPETRVDLNATPTMVALPRFDADERPTDVLEMGTYTVRVPRALTRRNKGKLVLLTYPRFRAWLLPPFSVTAADAAARQLHFRDGFDYVSSACHIRLDDMDAQPDLPSLKRFLLLISEKLASKGCAEEFEGADLRGFVLTNGPIGKRAVAQIYVPSIHAGCGIHFEDKGGLTVDDVHEFLAALRIDSRQAPATQAATRASVSVH